MRDYRLNIRLTEGEYKALELAEARWGAGSQSDLGRAILREWIGMQTAPTITAQQAAQIISNLQRIETKVDTVMSALQLTP